MAQITIEEIKKNEETGKYYLFQQVLEEGKVVKYQVKELVVKYTELVYENISFSKADEKFDDLLGYETCPICDSRYKKGGNCQWADCPNSDTGD